MNIPLRSLSLHNMHLYLRSKGAGQIQTSIEFISTRGVYSSMCHFIAYNSSILPSNVSMSHQDTIQILPPQPYHVPHQWKYKSNHYTSPSFIFAFFSPICLNAPFLHQCSSKLISAHSVSPQNWFRIFLVLPTFFSCVAVHSGNLISGACCLAIQHAFPMNGSRMHVSKASVVSRRSFGWYSHVRYFRTTATYKKCRLVNMGDYV